jgi:hypothetical protein
MTNERQESEQELQDQQEQPQVEVEEQGIIDLPERDAMTIIDPASAMGLAQGLFGDAATTTQGAAQNGPGAQASNVSSAGSTETATTTEGVFSEQIAPINQSN